MAGLERLTAAVRAALGIFSGGSTELSKPQSPDDPDPADLDYIVDPDSEPVHMPINGTLDLHTFSPKELPGLLDDYMEACIEEEIFDLRIIHGKGKGILRDRVRSILKRHRLVQSFEQAPPEAGGWGATLVSLNRR